LHGIKAIRRWADKGCKTGEKIMDELLPCPSCFYTEEKYDSDKKRWALAHQTWADFKPISYRDRLSGKWVIECQNCGMVILFNQPKESENIELWNELPRK
jgi:hypothetical protein